MNNSTIHTIGISILVTLIVGLAFIVMGLALQPKGRVSCADFGSYTDAKDALNRKKNPATWLDRDHDGKPCEVRFPKEVKEDSGLPTPSL